MVEIGCNNDQKIQARFQTKVTERIAKFIETKEIPDAKKELLH
jgi:hypothetical protein